MLDWIFKPNRRQRLINWWAVDAWLDSSVYGTWARYKDWYAGYSAFFARFRVTGFRWMMVELVSEGGNLSIAGLLLTLALAVPAIQETNNPNWRTGSDFAVTFYDRNGKEIGKRGILHSDTVPLEEIPDHMIKAVLATEDRRFFDHFGIDVIGTSRALVHNAQHREVQGGSSLTQQLAKNLFLSSERSLERKVKEAFIALWLEAHLTKREILKMYLDRSYMGGGTFGVEAASQFYFGKSVRDINLGEAALMAGLFKAPTKYAPHANPAQSKMRTDTVLTNLVEAGFMTEGQVHAARLNPPKVIDRTGTEGPNYYLDWAYEEVQRLMKDKGEYLLNAQTTLDSSIQKEADKVIEDTLDKNADSLNVDQAALVSMEATDGAVRAMVGGRDYGDSQFNRAAHGYRQAGSSFKTYVYLTALENGWKPSTVEVDGPVSCGNWSPENYGRAGYRGSMTLTDALKHSINTVAVKLSLKAGREKVLANVKKLGMNEVKITCSMALGDQGITPLEHTGGYAHFANGGKSVKPYAIAELRNSRGDVVYSHEKDEPPQKQIFDPRVIEALNGMLQKVVEEGTGTAAKLDFTYVAGKTGTSSGPKDAWFMGFTGRYVTGIWFGNDNFTQMNNVTGGHLAAPVFSAFNANIYPDMNIPRIPGLELHPRQQEEQLRLAEERRQDPALAAAAATAQPASQTRWMPPRTKTFVTNLNKMFKDAAKLNEQPAGANRGASLNVNAPEAAVH